MVEIDISNVWCNLSLPELLAVEERVAAAHEKVADAPWQSLPKPRADETVHAVWELGKDIRDMADVVLVVGGGLDSLGAQGVMELLQGHYRNRFARGRQCAVFFVGESLSSRRWEAIGKLTEGRDYALILLENDAGSVSADILARNLRWGLERRYGAGEAKNRIFAVCREGSALHTTAQTAGWRLLKAEHTPEGFGVLSGVGLLPLCAAGVDVEKVLEGAWEQAQELCLRSYENPAWLHAGARCALGRKGQKVEVLSCREPDFEALGKWWQGLACRTDGAGVLSACGGAGERSYAEHWLTRGNGAGFVTELDFDEGAGFAVLPDFTGEDGGDFAEGARSGEVAEKLHLARTETLTERGVSILSLQCGELNEKTVGALLYFAELSCAISGEISENSGENREETEG